MSPVEFVLSTFGRARLVGVVLVLLALVFFGAGFVFFMVDDGVLLALGDLFLLPGTWLLLGPTRLLSLARRAGPRGLGAFALGVCLVFAGWAASGLVVQVVGALELFGPTVPALLKTLRLIPGVGHVLALPPVAALLDALSVVSGGLSPNATYAMFALALAAGVPRLLGAGGGVGDAGSDPAAASAAAAAAAAAARKAAADAMDGGSAGSAAAEAAADAAAKAAATAAAAAAAAGGPPTAAWLLPLLVALAMAAGAVWCFTKESRSGSDVAAKGAAGSDAEAAGAESEAAVRAAAKAEAAADAVLLEAARKAVDAEEEEEEEEGEEGKAATTTSAASTDAQQFLKNKTGLLFGAVSSVSTGLLGALGVSKGDGGGGGAAAAAAAAAEEHVGDDDDDDDDGEAGGEDEDEAKEAGEEAGEGGAHVAIGSAEDDGMAWLGACDWVTMDSADVEAEIALLRHQGADGVVGVGVGGDDASAPGAAGAALHEEEDDARAADDAAAAKAVVERLSKPPPAGGFTLAESLRFEGVLRRCREEGSSDAAAQKAAELLPTFALLRWGAALTRAARENAQVRRAQLLGGIAQAATLCSPEQRQHHPESKAAASFPWLRDLRATLVNEGHTAAASACALADAEALIIEDARSAAAALGLDALAPPHWASPAVWTSGGCGDDVGGAAAEAAAVNLRAASTAEALEQALLAHCGAAEGAAEEGVVVGEDDDGEEDDGDEKKDATPSSGGATGGLLVPLQWLQPPRNAQVRNFPRMRAAEALRPLRRCLTAPASPRAALCRRPRMPVPTPPRSRSERTAASRRSSCTRIARTSAGTRLRCSCAGPHRAAAPPRSSARC